MANPVLVEVTRGDIVESRHRGAVAVVDGDGATVLAIGDVKQPVFPRSAVKAIQALPLVESGAADRYCFSDADIALACASHAGEPEQVSRAAAMLARAGLDETSLECGSHWPSAEEASRVLARDGRQPDQLHNNCSGKHSGFLCTCVHEGVAHGGYVERSHRVQQWVAEAMEAVTGAEHGEGNAAIDGCSIPTYAVPISSLALGFARMATGRNLPPQRAAAARRILAACMAEPFEVSGTGRADTRYMEQGGGRVFVKTGAEGVYCAALPELALGIALKCDDGNSRASEAMVAAIIARLLDKDELGERFAAFARTPVLTRKGAVVGEIRPAGELA
ncbi:MAG: asparaginase [Rhizobiaceae bacterium]|nr:asparaginase [Rhizobiaceae bacterium]